MDIKEFSEKLTAEVKQDIEGILVLLRELDTLMTETVAKYETLSEGIVIGDIANLKAVQFNTKVNLAKLENDPNSAILNSPLSNRPLP